MREALRTNLDLHVAFIAAGKKHARSQAATVPNISTHKHTLADRGLRTMMKDYTANIKHFAFRLIKSLIRPFASRVRRYLTDEIRQELYTNQMSITELLRNEVLARLDEEVFRRLERIEGYTSATARRVAINCGSEDILFRTDDGYILCPGNDYALLACLLEAGTLEHGTRILIQRLLKPGDSFVDVGANIGLHTLAAARALHGVGKIIAFEPYGPTTRLLAKTMWINNFSEITEIHQAAVSNHKGRQQLFLGATSGHHSLFALEVPRNLSAPPVDVSTIRLDEVINSGMPVHLLKIDAEGAELEVLESGKAIIQNNPDMAIIVEYGTSHLHRTGKSTIDWIAAFTDFGLTYRAIDEATGGVRDISVEQLKHVDSVNLLFARPAAPIWSKVEDIL